MIRHRTPAPEGGRPHPRSSPRRRALLAAGLAVVVAACGAAEAEPPPPAPIGTVGIGVLPAPPEATDGTGEPATTDETSTTESTVPDTSPEVTVPPDQRVVGELTDGNRVLMVGDSILASTSRRYGNNMCNALVPLGWQVAIEAEVSRTIVFGEQVLDARLDEGWDAVLLFLGNNYNGDENFFFAELNELIQQAGDVPVVLLTVTEFEADQVEVNEIVRGLAGIYENVVLVDWAPISTFPRVTGGDGLHLTDYGRQVLADAVAPYFGPAPAPAEGECLRSEYTDDSAGSVNGPPATTRPGSGGSGTTRTTVPSTTRPPSSSTPTATTAPGGSTATTAPSTGTTAPSGTTATTAPPPATSAPATAPPTQATTPPTQATTPPTQATTPPVTAPPATVSGP